MRGPAGGTAGSGSGPRAVEGGAPRGGGGASETTQLTFFNVSVNMIIT